VQARAKAIAQETKKARDGRHEAAKAKSTDSPIAAEWLAYCLYEVLPTQAIVLNEAVSHGVLTMNMVDRTIPGSLYDSGGSSLGWSLGAAIGMKLALPDKDIVALVGDGTFVYGTPTSALWAAEQYETPFMTVIFNNNMHWATKRALLRSFPDGVSAKTNRFIGVDIQPGPDFDVLATASRAYGERVDDPAEVVPALKRGLERIRAGQAAVIDVRIARY
jgi:acetolactate synthase-1/2/3 large subunit